MKYKGLAAWVALGLVPGVGPRRFGALLNRFKSLEAVWEAGEPELAAMREIGPAVAGAIAASRGKVDPEAEIERARVAGARIICWDDGDYPELLKRIYDPPPLLYVKGKLPPSGSPAAAVVGSRRPSGYGLKVAETLARDLVARGVVVVSGMARGIDSAAHRGALGAGGPTVAVLGSGIDVVYPSENRGLYQRIALSGAVVSEFPTGTRPLSGNFPARNRIISGLSLGTVVVEAAEGSGSLITVDFALEQGREVFAVPGPVNSPTSHGPHRLIKQGACLVESAADILEELGLAPAKSAAAAPLKEPAASGPATSPPRLAASTANPPLTPPEASVLGRMGPLEASVDEIARAAGLPAQEAGAALIMLEIRGLVRSLPGGRYILAG